MPPGTEKPNIIVIGKRTCSPTEIDALETIGYAIAHTGRQLHTPATPGAPNYVADGFRAAGGEPIAHSAGLGSIEGETLCILDESLATQLYRKIPDWDEKNWVVLQDEIELLDWTSALLGLLEETDRSLVAEGVGG